MNRFHEQYESYRSPSYNETQLRREFVDPFFKALGWDIDNLQGHAEAYKEVIHEDAIRIGGTKKAPDYSFRIGGIRKFFVETKKPSVNIADDVSPAFQLRRYGWSAKLPLSILTDFEEFAVYDCRIRPDKEDKPSTARVLYLTYEQYDDQWDKIAEVFSREAILKGAFDRYADSTKKKRGTAEVDDAFLADIEEWRSELAKTLAKQNADLTQRELNFAVQKTIDRIIFLRICEDRGIEIYGTLLALIGGPKIYARLCELFRSADDRYNSGLFHFTKEKERHEDPDEWTLSLAVDDKVLKEIIRSLYYPESPYEFSVLGADILGQVYEQFLGKVIRLTKGHQARVEDKPEVKKAGGVYYTPTYIVDYIVQNTVGKLLEGKEPYEVAGRTKGTWKPAKGARRLSVLDPACGSGSFLIGAYQYLLDWYRDWYVANDPKQHKDRVYQVRKDLWRLTSTERKRIVLDHIYGVDIDPQAVEVTKLSLLLKVLEGESDESLSRQLKLFHKQRALPDLGDNIKCGNSLIGPDFYKEQQLSLFDEEDRLRINVFDWHAEFREIMKSGGFDTVIGNPPYIRMEAFKELKDYLRQHYDTHAERSDLYVYFIEREHELLRDGGLFGMIVSNKFLRARYGDKVREKISSVSVIRSIIDLAGLRVFSGATVRTIVLISCKGGRRAKVTYCPPLPLDEFRAVQTGSRSFTDAIRGHSYTVNPRNVTAARWDLSPAGRVEVMEHLHLQGVPLNAAVDGGICMGIKSGLIEAFVISTSQRNAIVKANAAAKSIIFPFLQGRNIRRYRVDDVDQHLIYTHHGIDMKRYSAVIQHLKPFRDRLESRATQQAWYELQQPQYAYFELLQRPKIVFPDMAKTCRFALDRESFFGANTVYFLPTDDLVLLGLLNSRLAFFYFRQKCAGLEGGGEIYLRFFGQYLEDFPVAIAALSKKQHGTLLSCVSQLLKWHEQFESTKTDHERKALQRQIEATDREIDQLVYELYGLTDDEIRIVEEATAPR